MSISVFEFDDYKAFFLAKIKEEPNSGRGARRKLAEFIGCQIAYVSHVLAGDRHFSPEQAEAAARFFSLRDDETEFLFLILDHQRAGTAGLRRHLQKRIDQRRREYREIKKRIRISHSISPADQALYYSSWHYQAVHTILTIPEFRTPSAIASRLGLTSDRIGTILSFLLEKGLVKETASGYQPTESQIHLPRTSPLISKLHGNWRVQALMAMEQMRDEDYHYSGLVTLSRHDATVVREIMTKSLSQAIDVIKPSPAERLFVLAMDFYECGVTSSGDRE